jgi:hypothetical protein
MVPEGAMIVIATSYLTLLHLGIYFKGYLSSANFHFRLEKGGDILMETVSTQNAAIREE